MPRPILPNHSYSRRPRRSSSSERRPRRSSSSDQLSLPERNASFLQELEEAYDRYVLPILDVINSSDDLSTFLDSENITLTRIEINKLKQLKKEIVGNKYLFREYLEYLKNNVDTNTERYDNQIREGGILIDGHRIKKVWETASSEEKKNPYFLATEILNIMEFVQKKIRLAVSRRNEIARREAREATRAAAATAPPRGGSRKRKHRTSRSKRRHRTSRSKY